jgi:hypothetical protein
MHAARVSILTTFQPERREEGQTGLSQSWLAREELKIFQDAAGFRTDLKSKNAQIYCWREFEKVTQRRLFTLLGRSLVKSSGTSSILQMSQALLWPSNFVLILSGLPPFSLANKW